MSPAAHEHRSKSENTSGSTCTPAVSDTHPQDLASCAVRDILQALHNHSARRVRPAPWRIKACLTKQQGACYWCDRRIQQGEGESNQRALLESIVRADAGGTNDPDNLVAVCRSCDKRKGRLDPLGWCLTPEKRERREQALAVSHNHLLARPLSSKASVVRELKLRWANMRYAALAVCTGEAGWVAWPIVTGIPGPAAVVLRTFGGEFTTRERWTVVRLPRERFLDAVWMLIDTNGFVRPLPLPGCPDGTLKDDPERARWAETYIDMNDIVRRRPPLPSRWRPSSPDIRRFLPPESSLSGA